MKSQHTLEAVTLGNADDVDHLILREHLLYRQSLLEVLARPVDLLTDRTTVQLNLHDMSFLLLLL